MKKSVEYYISELLFLHDCIIIPEFGGFVCNKKSAQLNKKTGILTPLQNKFYSIQISKQMMGCSLHILRLKRGSTRKCPKTC